MTLEGCFDCYHRELLGTLYYLVGNHEDAADALQETFLKCWKHRSQLSEIRNLKAWVFRIALNTGRDIRQTAWRRRRKPLSQDESMISSPQGSPTAGLEHAEQLARLRQAVKKLRSEEQEVFLLRQNGQLTYEEISTVIGIPTGTVKTRMRLALGRLREVLK